MILLGAGTSVPFGVPAMKKFVDLFKQEISSKPKLSNLFRIIESSLNDSERLIGNKIDFDLESLMIVLQDLTSSVERPIATPTFAFALSLISQRKKTIGVYNIRSVRRHFGRVAKVLLEDLQSFIFNKCIEPIQKGQKENVGYSFLDFFYGSLFATLDYNIFNPNVSVSWVFSTNWDLCFKQWLEYIRVPFQDGTKLDAQRKPVLRPSDGWGGESGVKVVPLHGCFDLLNCTRLVSGKTYTEITKIINPEIYFVGNLSELSKAFIVYPIEAVGYDQSVKSPYLDMLVLLKSRLEKENNIFVAGFSFRDSIIASIFDEVIRKKSEEGKEQQMKILVIDSNPQNVIDNVKRQGYSNLANLIIPVQVEFPKTNIVDGTVIASGIQEMIEKIVATMISQSIHYDRGVIKDRLKKYGIEIDFSARGKRF